MKLNGLGDAFVKLEGASILGALLGVWLFTGSREKALGAGLGLLDARLRRLGLQPEDLLGR